MKPESIKNLFASLKNDKKAFISSEFCEKKLRKNIRKIKRCCDVIKDDEGGLWLRENAAIVLQTLGSIQTCNVSIRKQLYEAVDSLVSSQDFVCEREEITSFLENLFKTMKPLEIELSDIRFAFYLVLSDKIVFAAEEMHDLLPRFITIYHKLNSIDFDQLIQRYSPVEKILRCDPSGIWQRMTKTTQRLYKRKLLQKAKKQKKQPEKVAAELVQKANKEETHFGTYLFDNKKIIKPIFFTLLFFIYLMVEFIVAIDSLVLAAFVSIPLYFFAKHLTEFIVSILTKPEPLPAMRVDKVSENEKTCVVITSLVTTEKDIDGLLSKLLQYSKNNASTDDEIYFGLLCDLKESDYEFEEKDAIIIDYLKEKIESLHDKHFFAAIRPRVYHASEEKWVGWERKRGAIDQLIRHLSGEKLNFIHFFGSKKEIIGSRFLITLDADTSLRIGQAKRLIGIGLHPLNEPVVSKIDGKFQVTSGYGILQPGIISSLLEPITTPFGKIFGNGSGNLAYSTASYDHMQHFYSEGNFCGKGLINVSAYQCVMRDALPEQMILSHDMPEGALMRCALVSNEHLSDSTPQTTESHYKRQHRWIRGDVQNLKIFKLLNFHRKWFLFENLMRYLIPVSEWLLLIISGLIGKKEGIACALLVLLFHSVGLITTALSILVSGNISLIGRRFVTKIRNLILNGFYKMVLSLSALIFEAHLFTDAIIRSLYRMLFSKKKLLEWQVYSAYSKGNKKLQLYLPSIFLTVLSCLLARNVFQIMLFVLCLSFPVISGLISTPYEKKRDFNQKEKEYLREKAQKEFLFFQRFVNENTNYLPPDNIQLAPVEKIAMRTSPTNIGLYLASLVAAEKMNLISEQEMVFRLKKAMDSLDRMNRWNGHLYNWYDLSTLKVIGSNFVSTVDSGNYACCMIVVKEALCEIKQKSSELCELIQRIEIEISRLNFLPLYNSERNLLRVGVDAQERKQTASDYDLYMSESRTTSFLCIALGQLPVCHWSSLGRPLFSFRGRVGIGSWSGTAFEFFMPILFLPIVENSLEDESLDFALYCQKKYCSFVTEKQKVFGISESGYSLIDAQDNYQYKAFGVPYLSFQPNVTQNRVVSPYSTFLMLPKKDPDLIKNLINLSKIGMEGEFGFYEACEFFSQFIGDYQIVQSYMSHHKGMSFLSLANVLCDDVIQKWFLSYDGLKCKEELLAERFPLDGAITKKKIARQTQKIQAFEANKRSYSVTESRDAACHITDGKLGMIFYSNGENRFLYHGDDLFISKGISISIYLDRKKILFQNNPDAEVIFCSDHVSFSLRKKKSLISIAFKPIAGKNAFLINTSIQGFPGECKIEISFGAVLERRNVYEAHPAFHNLALEATAEHNHVWIRRRGEEDHRYLHIFSSAPIKTAVQGKGAEYSFNDRMLLTPDVTVESEFQNGNCVNAVYAFSLDKRETTINPMEYLDGSFDLQKWLKLQNCNKLLSVESGCHFNNKRRELESEILCAGLDNRSYFILQDTPSYKRDSLWGYGISGDHPIILCLLDEKDSLSVAEDLMCVLKKMKRSGIGFDLVLLHNSSQEYFDPIKDQITEAIGKLRCEYLIGKHPGIHVVPYHSESEKLLFLCCAAFIFGSKEYSLPCISRKEVAIEQAAFSQKETANVVGTIESGDFVLNKNEFAPKVSFSQVVSNQVCGFICNQNSLGFTWYRNAGLNRVSAWDNLPREDTGEKIYYLLHGKAFDLLQMASLVRFKRHFAIYEGEVEGKKYQIIATVSAKVSGKLMFTLTENFDKEGELIYSFVPALGAFPRGNVLIDKKENMLFLAPAVSGDYSGKAYFYSKEAIAEVFRFKDRICIKTNLDTENVFALGGFSTNKHAEYIKSALSKNLFEEILRDEKIFCDLFSSKKLSYEESWIQYQSIHCRFFARSGQYQSSGAYGFRDQLQDSLVFLDVAPEFTKRHILRAAAHQFEEGDVQHWWHGIAKTRGCHPGIRSRCSDDYLWLLYVTSEYISNTGDDKILDLNVPFIKAPILTSSQDESYLVPERGESAPLIEHLKRAALLFITRGLGPHDLPFIGSGDWNDGMNKVDGESVWLGAFGSICLKRILPYLDVETFRRAEAFLKKINVGIENSFNGCWFARVYRKDGSTLGNDVSLESECSFDLITQAFAAFYHLEFQSLSDKCVKNALESAYEILFDPNTCTTKLFSKPFVRTAPTPGYIQRYCAGARENGGQYTHAAVWFALALLKFGEKINDKSLIQKGMKIGTSLNPFLNLDLKKFKSYQREPYVLCGDIFTASGLRGHGGWSWYTGAAGWYLKLKKEMKRANNQ